VTGMESMIDNYLLSAILFVPLVGALVIALLPRGAAGVVRVLGMLFSCLAFLLSVVLFVEFDGANPGMQFIEKVSWIPQLHVSYAVGVDGISLLLIVLTTFLTPIALLASWESIGERVKGFVALM